MPETPGNSPGPDKSPESARPPGPEKTPEPDKTLEPDKPPEHNKPPEPDEKTGEERREYFRIGALLPLGYRPVAEKKPAPPRPLAVNLSGGGLRFETERHFIQGESLAITLVLPGTPTIRTQAEVVYYLPPERKASTQHPVAVRFTTITDKEREAIVRYVAQLQVDRPSISGRNK